MNSNARTALSLVFLQALIATLGSLYFSNFGDPVANAMAGNFFPSDSGFLPCHLCWWARILMYPILLVSIVGLWTHDNGALKYTLMLSLPGIGLDLYHYALQKLPFMTSEFCTKENPCTAMSVNYLGFITIPFLALSAFCIIFVLSVWGMKNREVV